MLSFLDILIVFFIFALFSIAYWYLSKPRNLPPGPIGLPFIGSALDCIGSDDVLRVLKKYAKTYGPLYKLYILNKLVVVLADYDTIQEALVKQGDTFAGRNVLRFIVPKKFHGVGLILSEGSLWKEERRFALSTLRDFGLGRPILEGRIKEETEYLHERLQHYASSGEAFNPNLLLTFAIANIICQLIFGKRFSYDDEVLTGHFVALTKRVSGAGATMISPIALSPIAWSLVKLTPQFQKITKEEAEFDEFLDAEVKNVIASYDPDALPDNYIHAYLKASPHVVNDDNAYLQLLGTVIDLFIAGSETTSTTLCWGILFLAHNPDVQEKMHQEIKEKAGLSSFPSYGDRSKMPYTEAVITEVQRLADLLPMGVTRRCVKPTDLLGYHIPEDAIVVALLTNVLHDPDMFPDPQRFNPDRFLDANGKFVRHPKMIPFQAGKRICLGESLARMELFLSLTALQSRFRFFFPRNNPSPSLKPITGFTCSPEPYLVCVEARGD